ncbi:MAG: substrate-binding domain-containing protein [Sphaerochaetaceae bacterium]|jgi:ABC-type sugar transport system substrate-binding protein|nr:substrate-binding domain-containing protein [Sphaerochaetaceae bacterium]MDY0372167.1 substrate-binding domain-containing protein [Sphaerochaetaceae bacterium]
MKKVLQVLLVLTMVLVLGGQVFAAAQAETGRPKVAGVVFQEDQFMKLLQLGYKDTAEKAGFDFYPGNTNGDAAKEAEFLNTYVTQGYKGVAISPISEEASLKVLTDAANKGLLIGISNHEFNLPFLTGAFTSDNYNLGSTVGKAAAKYIKENLGGKATIAIVQFKTLLPEQSGARSKGFIDQVKDLPGVKIVTDQDAWMQDKAITIAGDIITAHSDVNLIFAANEGGTIGSTMAVKNAGKAGKIAVFGFDGSEQIVQLLKDPANVLQAAIAQDPYNIGVKTMESVVKAVKGEDYSSTKGQSFIVPGILLERANPAGLDAFLADLKSKM